MTFTHKPKPHTLDWVHPTLEPVKFKTLWEKAKEQDFYKNAKSQVTYVGSDDEHHYFQEQGNTGGFARVSV